MSRTPRRSNEKEPVISDPILARINAFRAVPVEERLDWVQAMTSALEAKLKEIPEATAAATVYEEFVNEATRDIIVVRLKYLDVLRSRLIGDLAKK